MRIAVVAAALCALLPVQVEAQSWPDPDRNAAQVPVQQAPLERVGTSLPPGPMGQFSNVLGAFAGTRAGTGANPFIRFGNLMSSGGMRNLFTQFGRQPAVKPAPAQGPQSSESKD